MLILNLLVLTTTLTFSYGRKQKKFVKGANSHTPMTEYDNRASKARRFQKESSIE